MNEAKVFINRVKLKNYKSIAACDVQLNPLIFLVGPNSAGKSNFLDALRFVSESLDGTLEHALRERGGINEVRRRSSGHPTNFGIRLEFSLPNGDHGFYAFQIGALPSGGFEVQSEQCEISEGPATSSHVRKAAFIVKKGKVDTFKHFFSSEEREFEKHLRKRMKRSMPPASPDRLFLTIASGYPGYRPLYNALTNMGFYNLNPDRIRELQPPDNGKVLKRDGSNLTSVLDVMAKQDKNSRVQVISFLEKVVPGITDVKTKQLGKHSTLEFHQNVGQNKDPWRFHAENMSDGTLRALGILVALHQDAKGRRAGIPLIGIEEPETAIHPGAAAVIRDSLRAASTWSQVIVTSHSPELLDDKDIDASNLLAVQSEHGTTHIAPIDKTSQEALKKHLATTGELLKQNMLNPDPAEIKKRKPRQLNLFSKEME